MQDILMYASIFFGILGVIFLIKVLLNVTKVAKIKEDLLNFNASDLDVTHIKSYYQTQVKGNKIYSDDSKIGGFVGVQPADVVKSKLVDDLEVSLDDLQFVPLEDRKGVAERVASSSVLVNEIDVGTTMLAQEDSATQPLLNEEITQPLLNEEVTQPLLNEEVTQPLLNEEVTQPLLNEEVTQPLLNEEVTQPLLNEEVTQPLLNEEVTQPLLNEEVTVPLVDEEVTVPLVSEEATQPLLDDELTQPLNKKA